MVCWRHDRKIPGRSNYLAIALLKKRKTAEAIDAWEKSWSASTRETSGHDTTWEGCFLPRRGLRRR